jgi:hypothetical protein
MKVFWKNLLCCNDLGFAVALVIVVLQLTSSVTLDMLKTLLGTGVSLFLKQVWTKSI